MARLGDICVKKIDTIKATYEGDIDYIDISSVDNQCKEITQTQSMPIVNAPSRAKQLVFPGDILVSTVRPNLNAVALVTENFENTLVASTGYCVLRCLPNVDNKYVFYFCQSPAFIKKMVAQATGASYPAVTSAIVRECTIPLPPLEEQRRIAATLDKISDLIAKRRVQLDKLDLLVKSRFVEMFGDPLHNTQKWRTIELTKVCKTILGGGTPSKSHPEYFMGTVPWVSPKDMKKAIISDSIDHITEEAIASSTTNLIPVNSVLMVIRSGILKHTLPVAINSVPVTINQDMKAFVPDDDMLPEFLMHYFKAIEFDVLTGVRGVTADNIDFKAFQKRQVIVPPIEVQKKFATFVKRVNKSKLMVQQGSDKLETLKKSLMQHYFG